MANKNLSNRPEEPHVPPEALAPPAEVSDPMIAAIVKRLEAGQSVRRKLPSGGYLHLDRQVPFLLVYRRPVGETSDVAEQLLRGEASYLIIDSKRRLNKSTVTLVSSIAESLAKSFGWRARPLFEYRDQSHRLPVAEPGSRTPRLLCGRRLGTTYPGCRRSLHRPR